LSVLAALTVGERQLEADNMTGDEVGQKTFEKTSVILVTAD